MIYERWKTQFNIEQLQFHLKEYILSLPPIFQSPSFGGWSVLSSNGSYTDGWHRGYLGIQERMDLKSLRQQTEKNGGKVGAEYVLPTEICHGYLLDVIEYIKSKGLNPSRARVIQLPAGHSCIWHRDAPDNVYCVRLHIPILTNENCYFEIENGRAHLPADGSAYFLHVNRMHRVVNEGQTSRYHLVMNVRDDLGISQNHQWNPKPKPLSV